MKKYPCHRFQPSETQSSPISRRDFLKVTGAFVGGLALASCIPSTTPSATVAIVKAESYDPKLVRQQVQAALDAIGGVGNIIRPGASVAIKINLVGGTCCNPIPNATRVESYWTHPQVVQALGELLRDAGAKKLYIMEYADEAYYEVSKSLGATLVNVDSPTPYKDFYTAPVATGGLIYENFKFNAVLDNVDAFISVPKMKCHSTMGVTLSMKNLIGLGPSKVYHGAKPDDPGKFAFHTGPDDQEDPKKRLPRVIVDLNRARPIHLALVDGITTTDGGEGPWCDTHFQTPHVLIAGKNPLATDAVAAAVMGFDPTAEYPNVPFVNADNYMNIARSVGLGTNRLEEIEVKGVSIDAVRQKFAPSLVVSH
jgi:uncharacterized protein (DUF362 family)